VTKSIRIRPKARIMAAFRDAFLEVDGATLSYSVEEGAAPTIVGLHGLTSSRRNEAASGFSDWSAVSATGRRSVRYDARGHGLSTGRPVPEDYAWPRLADDLFRLLDAVAPGETVDAFGVSMGVGTLLHAVTREPDRFRRLAFVIPPTAWETRAAQGDLYRQMAAMAESGGRAALAAAAATMEPLPILAEGGWTAMVPPDISEPLLPAVMRGAAATDFPSPEAIGAIRKPVLLLPWTDDPGHPLSTAERLHELIPDSALHVTRTPDDLRAVGLRVAAFLNA
jgi:pimeloyl-ACP methyl ester carboxylesterase